MTVATMNWSRRLLGSLPAAATLVGAVISAAITTNSFASVVYFQNDYAGWSASASSYATCSFAEFPQNTFITDQYANLGVLFTGFTGNVVKTSAIIFPLDSHGIDGNCGIELTFAAPTYSVGAHGPDVWKYLLYQGNTLIHTSTYSNGGIGNFAGIVSSVPFDRVQFKGFPLPDCDDVYIDNIYFSSIPAPAAIAVLVMAWPLRRARRR